jgi:hypothetical protein
MRFVKDRPDVFLEMDVPHANRHWDSDSLYVTPRGVPVVYSMEFHGGKDGVLIQA